MELEIPVLSVRWSVDIRKRPNWEQPLLSPEFSFQGGRWCLSYYYGMTDGHCLVLEKMSAEEHAPFSVLIQLEGRGTERIVIEKLSDNDYVHADESSRHIWVKDEYEIVQSDPDLNRSNHMLRFLVNLKKDENLTEFELVGTQTECSIPEGFEVSCMESLSEDFTRLMVQGSEQDVRFRCADECIDVHGAVVCSRSPVIASMLASDMVEGRTRVVDIQDVAPDIFRHFLIYLYSGKLPTGLTFEATLALYEFGDQYAVLGLARRCSRLLADYLSVQNACDVLVLADAHCDRGLLERVVNFMVEKKVPRSSDRWPALCDAHPRLAIKVLDRFCV